MNNVDNSSHLFPYKEPEDNEDVNLFFSEQVPWFYHLMHVLKIRGNEFSQIKEYVTNKRKKIKNDHVLNIIDFDIYADEMLKLNGNLKNTLSIYLYYCKYQLEKASQKLDSDDVRFIFVFGNITADMDSICSSILFSFFLFLWNELKIKSGINKESTKTTLFIPVINIKRKDISLKIMITWWMQKIEIYDPQNVFIFHDNEHLLQVLKHKHKYDVCLVDFNDFENSSTYDKDNVKCIIDHHMFKRKHTGKEITKSIFPIYVCSCMVIIAYMYKYSSEYLRIPFVNKNIMWMIYGTILRDSNNFRSKDRGKRWVLPDLHIFNSLKDYYKISNKVDIFLTYEFEIVRFSIDLKKFGIANLLSTDYKDYCYNVLDKKIKLRIASIDFSINMLFTNEDTPLLINKLFEICKENDIYLFIFIGSFLNNGAQLHKDIGLFFYADELNPEVLIDTLASDKSMTISNKCVKQITDGKQSKTLYIYGDLNRSYSRKMLEYLLNDFFCKFQENVFLKTSANI